MNFDHWIMPLVQYATQKPGQNNKGKWKLSNLINNKCEKGESTRSKEIIILTAMRPMIKGNGEKKQIIINVVSKIKIEIPFSWVLIFKMKLLQISIICSCWSRVALYKIDACSQESGRFTPIWTWTTRNRYENSTHKKRSTKNWTPSSVRASHRFPFGDNAQVQTEWSIRKAHKIRKKPHFLDALSWKELKSTAKMLSRNENGFRCTRSLNLLFFLL